MVSSKHKMKCLHTAILFCFLLLPVLQGCARDPNDPQETSSPKGVSPQPSETPTQPQGPSPSVTNPVPAGTPDPVEDSSAPVDQPTETTSPADDTDIPQSPQDQEPRDEDDAQDDAMAHSDDPVVNENTSPEHPSTKPTHPQSPSPVLPSIQLFSVSESHIAQGKAVGLQWATTGGAKVVLQPGIGIVTPTGQRKLKPTTTTTYILTVYSEDHGPQTSHVSSALTVTVSPQSPSAPQGGESQSIPDECDHMTSEALAQKVSFNSSTNQIYKGESIRLDWSVNVPHPSPTSNVATQLIRANENTPFLTSGSGKGMMSLKPETTTKYTMTVDYCGLSFSKEVSVEVQSWTQESYSDVSTLVLSKANILWLGKNNGSLLKSTDNGDHWTTFPSRKYKIGNSIKTDNSPITSVLEMTSGCPGSMFFGSADGWLYRSLDGGSTLNGLKGDNYAIAFLDHKPVHFIVQDGADPKKLYIGAKNGVWKMNACDATEASTFEQVTDADSTAGAYYQGFLYVADSEGLHKTPDSGDTWEEISPNKFLWLRVMSGKLYAARGSALLSFDGFQWKALPHGANSQAFLRWQGVNFTSKTGEIALSRNQNASLLDLEGIESDDTIIALEIEPTTKTLWGLTKEGDVYTLPFVANPLDLTDVNFFH